MYIRSEGLWTEPHRLRGERDLNLNGLSIARLCSRMLLYIGAVGNLMG